MKIAVFSTKPYDRHALEQANREHGHELTFFESRLTPATAALARGFDAICPFVNDDLSEPVIDLLADAGVRLLTLRSAGYNHVDLRAAARRGLTVAHVPAYSPHAVAEHAMGMILTLNRKFHRAYARVREGNFALEGLLGFDIYRKTMGVVGTGQIGAAFCQIALGFGCRVLAYDLYPNSALQAAGVEYADLNAVLSRTDIIALHVPLTPQTRHMIDAESIARMKPGVMLINTSRGALVDTPAVIAGLKSGQIGALGLDVYEEEADLFFEDLSSTVIQDDVFARLLTFPNVLVTGHQGFFTKEALERIAGTTLTNATAYLTGSDQIQKVPLERIQFEE
ncbi:MAG: hydroxyacid dehydrogenase [Sorangiineae bacterium NIC37A_2]|nr:MAG: hydroxyacid dehydrogenase [Sorangiineae bacterium NIC37A_2]